MQQQLDITASQSKAAIAAAPSTSPNQGLAKQFYPSNFHVISLAEHTSGMGCAYFCVPAANSQLVLDTLFGLWEKPRREEV